jgi:hypothetical protein
MLSAPIPKMHPSDSYILTMPGYLVTELTDELNGRKGALQPLITPTDCICAILWLYITRATLWNEVAIPEDKTVLTVTTNAREFFSSNHADLPLQTLGKLSTTMPLKRAVQTFLDPEPLVSDEGEFIRRAASLAALADAALQIREHLGSDVRSHDPLLSEAKSPTVRTYRQWDCIINLTSLADHGADINFGIPGTTGDGRPKFCRVPWGDEEEGTVYILPRKGKTSGTEDWDVQVYLPRKTLNILTLQENLGQFLKRYVDDADPAKYARSGARPNLFRAPIHIPDDGEIDFAKSTFDKGLSPEGRAIRARERGEQRMESARS